MLSLNANKSPLLEVNSLKMHFPIRGGVFGKELGKVYAVDGVSFVLKAGQTIGLVGESGCGKSTLGRTILRLYRPTSGEVKFDGKDITTLSSRQMRPVRREIQMIFQDPFSSLNARMNVGSIIAEPFLIHRIHRTRAEIESAVAKLLETVGLNPDAAKRFPHEFSGGQRQRIGIARALALKPKLIVADEPVSALDVSIQSQVLNLMVDLRKAFDLSYLFIAHDLAVIEHISDLVAVMYLGRIVEFTTAEQLYLSPRHPYTKALISAIPVADFTKKDRSEREVLIGDVPSPMNPPSGCHFHPRCKFATDRCRHEVPQLRELETKQNSHVAACHYA